MPDIVLVAALAANRVIGRDNQLIWHVPEDMAHFRQITAGRAVLMGRKTWESLPERFRPLPGRRNIVITRQAAYAAPGAVVAGSLAEGVAAAGEVPEVCVIGGADIYTQALALADRLCLTELDISPEGDAHFPPLPAGWTCVERTPFTSSSGISGAFATYRRQP